MFQSKNDHSSTSTTNDEFATMQSRLFVVCSQGRRVKVSWIKANFKLKALLSNKGHMITKKYTLAKENYTGRVLNNKSSGKVSEKAWRGKLTTGMLYEIA